MEGIPRTMKTLIILLLDFAYIILTGLALLVIGFLFNYGDLTSTVLGIILAGTYWGIVPEVYHWIRENYKKSS
jgi:hypothetical protein